MSRILFAALLLVAMARELQAAKDALDPISLLAATKQGIIRYQCVGNGRNRVTISLSTVGDAQARVRLRAGQIFENGEGARVMALQEALLSVTPQATVEVEVPVIALSSGNRLVSAPYHPLETSEPRLESLVTLAAAKAELPRTTAQLLALCLLEDVVFAQWKDFLASEYSASPSDVSTLEGGAVVQAIDAVGLLRQLAPGKRFALATDSELKLRALRNPACRTKAAQLFGVVTPDELGPGAQTPDLSQLLHTKSGDNCPVCRSRESMQRDPSGL